MGAEDKSSRWCGPARDSGTADLATKLAQPDNLGVDKRAPWSEKYVRNYSKVLLLAADGGGSERERTKLR